MVGTTSIDTTLIVPDSIVPTISGVTAEPVNGSALSDWNAYIQGYSGVKLTPFGASGTYGSTISSYVYSGAASGTQNATSSSYSVSRIDNAGVLEYKVCAVDSRGRYSSPVSVSIEVVPYSRPNVTSATAERSTSSGTVDGEGTYINVKIDGAFSSLEGKNALTVKCYYQKIGASTWTTGVSSMSLGTTYTIGGGNIDPNYSYQVKFVLTDALGSTERIISVGTASYIVFYRTDGTGVGVGKVCERDHAFEVNGDWEFYHGSHHIRPTAYGNEEPANPKDGLVWLRPTGFVYDPSSGSASSGGGLSVVYTPHVSSDGVISWTNNGELSNPSPVTIRGSKGDDGYSPEVSLLRVANGVQISVTNKNGTSTQTVFDGTSTVSDDVPAYWKTHLDTRVAEIRSAMSAAGFNKSAFLWYHDSHYSYSYKRSPMLLKYLYRHTPINRTIFGGDIIDTEADDAQTMEYLWDWREAIRDLPNHHSVPGNHDDGNSPDNRWDDFYIYAYLLAAEETPDVVRGDSGLYYYIDAPAERTRYLYLDTATADGNIINDQVEKDWLVSTLKSTPNEWHIVAVAHIWRTYDSGFVDNAWGYGGKYCLDQFDAYNARSGPYYGCTGRVEFCVGGHTHVDADHVSDGGIPVILTECDSRHVRSGLACTEGTITEAAVSAIIADYTKRQVSVIRAGRGSSRVVNLPEIIVPAGYTNQLPIATDSSGNIYNGKGYKEDTRISTSSQSETSAAGWCLTGYIPATRGDVIRMKNVTFLDINDEATTDRTTVYFFTADYGYGDNTSSYSPTSPMGDVWNPVYGDNGDVVQFTIPTSYGSTMKYIRICVKHLDQDSIITVNEEII